MSGGFPPMLATSLERHGHLHRCPACGTYWEQEERFAAVIDETQARAAYPEAFPAG